ncbi:MAG: ATP-dependent metallopeptidase FtsH/Yme1/Tma family protein, partial [Ktedonobacteraceae bacterium]
MDLNPNQSSMEPQGKPSPPRPKWTRFLPWILLIVFFIIAWFLPSLLGQGGTQSTETVSYTTFVEQVNANNVQSVTINGYTITGVFKSPVSSADGTTKSTQFTTTVPEFGNNDLIPLLQEHNVAITVQP